MKVMRQAASVIVMLFSAYASADTSRPLLANGYPLYPLRSGIWKTNNVQVCWESSDQSWTTEKNWVREAVEQSWQRHSVLRFVGWNDCAPDSKGIRIEIADGHPHTKGLGSQLDGKQNGMLLNFSFENWSPTCKNSREYCIQTIAVHEFGHAISFAHEHNRPDTPRDVCTDEPTGTGGDFLVTEYDPHSVMNYCNPVWSGDGELGELDIKGLQLMYGDKRPLSSYHESCASFGNERDASCMAALHRFCALTGKAGASYPQEYAETEMAAMCVQPTWYGDVSFNQLAQFHEGCSGPSAVQTTACYAAAHRYCDSIGNGPVGMIQEIGQGEVGLACMPANRYSIVKMADLTPHHGNCSAPYMAQDPACRAASHRYCSSNGYGDGGVILELGADEVALACLNAEWYGAIKYQE